MKLPAPVWSEEIRILHALGDALVREHVADVVVGEKAASSSAGDVGVDGHRSLLRRLVVPQRTGQREEHALLRGRHGLHTDRVARGEGVDDLLDQHFRRRGAGGDAETRDGAESRSSRCRRRAAPAPRAGSRRAPRPRFSRCEFDEFGAPTTMQRIDHAGRRASPPPGGWWWRSRCLPCAGPTIAGKRPFKRCDDRRGVVDRQRRLRHVGELAGVARRKLLARRSTVSISVTAPAGNCPMVPIDFRMAGMADEHDLAAAAVMDLGLAMHLGDQRAGGVEREQVALRRLRRHRLRHAMRGEDDRRAAVGNLVELLDEDRALGRAGFRPRSGCARSRGAHRPAARKSSAPARPIRWRAPRRRKSRAASRAALSKPVFPQPQPSNPLENNAFFAPTWAAPPFPVKPRRLRHVPQVPIFRPLSDHPR